MFANDNLTAALKYMLLNYLVFTLSLIGMDAWYGIMFCVDKKNYLFI